MPSSCAILPEFGPTTVPSKMNKVDSKKLPAESTSVSAPPFTDTKLVKLPVPVARKPPMVSVPPVGRLKLRPPAARVEFQVPVKPLTSAGKFSGVQVAELPPQLASIDRQCVGFRLCSGNACRNGKNSCQTGQPCALEHLNNSLWGPTLQRRRATSRAETNINIPLSDRPSISTF